MSAAATSGLIASWVFLLAVVWSWGRFGLWRTITGEFLLEMRPNGGDIIAVRALWITALVVSALVGFEDYQRPGATLRFDVTRFGVKLAEGIDMILLVYGGTYAGLYARFSAQWQYLAGLYNQLMFAKIQDPPVVDDETYMNLWAAFVEDAENTHLAFKPEFRSIIREMRKLKDDRYKIAWETYRHNDPHREDRLRKLDIRLALEP